MVNHQGNDYGIMTIVVPFDRYSINNHSIKISAMKRTIYIFLSAIVLISACGGHTINTGSNLDPRDTVIVPEGLSGEDSIAYIENMIVKSPISATDLLRLAEVHTVQDRLFHCYEEAGCPVYDPYSREDHQTERRDSAAMSLANQLIRMAELVNLNGDANDKLQWAVAVNAAIDSFHVAVPSLPINSVISDINRVVSKFSNDTQSELNFKAYVGATVDYYCTIEAYRQWLSEVPSNLKSLMQNEYVAWHNFNEARFAFWRDVSYNQEWYSMKPMEIEEYYENLSANRHAELEIERGIILEGKSYLQKGKTVTSAQWEKWITDHSVPEDIDYLRNEFWEDRIPSDSIVNNRVNTLKSTFSQWMEARKAIAKALPQEQSKWYDNMTSDIFCRLVGRLNNIIPLEEL